MKYIVEVNGARHEVELSDKTPGAPGQAQLTDLDGTPVHLVTLGDAVHRVVARRGEERGQWTLWIDGHRYQAEALDERTRTIRDLTAVGAGEQGPRPLLAPMPGLIVRIHVAVGDAVEAGQALVVMEAMKMENELRSPSSGVVTAILVKERQAVEKQARLVEIGSSPSVS